MTTQTTETTTNRSDEATVPMALHVPEAFIYVDRGLQRASDWVEYTVHAGLYRIRFTTRNGVLMDGNTQEEAKRLGLAKADAMPYEVDRTAFLPYYAVAKLNATKTRSYHENQLLSATSGHHEEHDELTSITWSPYSYMVKVGTEHYSEWQARASRTVYRAEVVELQPCEECKAAAGERCEEGCQGEWDGIGAANAGSTS